MIKSRIVELLKNYSLYKSRSLFLKKEISLRKQSAGTAQENRDEIDRLEIELSRLEHKADVIETGMKMAGEYNERYKYILEAHFINNVRIEDIADMTHMSRSRCYELCNEAVLYLSKIIFGEDQERNII
jgi:hypothetical protein